MFEKEAKANELHYVKDGDFPPDRKVVYEQNGYKVYYDSFQGVFIYVGSNTEAEVECWKEIE